MLKKIIFILLISFSISNCVSLNEINEKAKGDGIPYVPGI
tara:strand:- start:85 stop:204 length:120 start_codon:yes stop_codon:yes gene_type:complete